MFRRLIYLIFLLTFSFKSSYAEVPENFRKLIDQYGFEESSYGFAAKNLSDQNGFSINFNQDKLFNPASLVKILSTYIALKDLGPNYRWKSSFYHNGTITGDSLNGDLIFTGGGDATFSIINLEQMIREVQRKGIKKITGDLVLDYSFFGDMPTLKDFDDAPLRAYNVLPSAIALQSNTINFKFLVDKNKINIISDPRLEKLAISHDIRLSNGKCTNWKSRLTISAEPNRKKTFVKFLGSFSKRCLSKEIDLAVLDESLYFYENFKSLWVKNGGTFDGNYKKNYSEITKKTYLNSHYSNPLSQLIRDVNKFSLNLMARNLMLTVIKEKNSVNSTEGLVNAFVDTWVEKEGLLFESLFVDNGAGLSRKTQISVDYLMQILQKIYNDPFMPEMIASLPIASIDGTLKNKMKTSKFTRKGHFKTGSLKDVVGIAGFYLNAKKDMNAFVFIMNNEEAKNAQPFIEDLIELTL